MMSSASDPSASKNVTTPDGDVAILRAPAPALESHDRNGAENSGKLAAMNAQLRGTAPRYQEAPSVATARSNFLLPLAVEMENHADPLRIGGGSRIMLKIDLGCGPVKRPDFIGVILSWDTMSGAILRLERLPFDDRSVDHIFQLTALSTFRTITYIMYCKRSSRVAADDALIEIWHPYAFHGDAFVLGHLNYLSEELYAGLHFYWRDWLGVSWAMQEVRYCVEAHALGTSGLLG